jgi:quinol monooxygenase YgiN
MLIALSLSMILVILHMKVSAKNRKELFQTVISLLGTIRTEKGCGRCDFFHGLEDENILCLLEEWDTEKSFAAHRKSECFKVLRGAMNLLEEPCSIISCRSMPGNEGIGQPFITNSQIFISKKKGTHESTT